MGFVLIFNSTSILHTKQVVILIIDFIGRFQGLDWNNNSVTYSADDRGGWFDG